MVHDDDDDDHDDDDDPSPADWCCLGRHLLFDPPPATVQSHHLALAFKVLPLMVKEKVSARVLTADAPELNFRGKKNWKS